MSSRLGLTFPPPCSRGYRALADPVVTGSGDLLRFEAFSSCCTTYARIDLLEDALEGSWHGRGTTNVDFNPPFRVALARVRDTDDLGLSVGTDQLVLTHQGAGIVERKVALPVRWLKGFLEVQAYQARMTRKLEVSGLEADRFLRSLPRGAATTSGWIVPSGRGLRLSQLAGTTGVRVGGVQRLHLLDHLMRHARTVRIYADERNQAIAWELVLAEARFTLVLSHDASRGFSGEGQVLTDLAKEGWRETLPRVHATLKWEARIEPDRLANDCSFDRPTITAALVRWGRGASSATTCPKGAISTGSCLSTWSWSNRSSPVC